ncbi:MAG TPA: ATP-binding protein [Chryseolinea sp.]|nr:ATP-binding protein [Chryseolinea sp.]HPM31082.1 ATP-binding protein [Chryseolinea sp.]
MEKITRYRSAILYSIVAIVAALLLINVMLIYQNSLTIESSKKNQEDAERVKVNTLDIIRNLHRLDIGIRGYALVNNPALLATADTAKLNRDLIFNRLEGLLIKQQYPNMREFQILKDSITSYFSLTDLMLKLINEGKRTEFNSILDQDRGYGLWLMYKDFSKHVNHFEDQILAEAKHNYEQALRNSYLLQAIIFILAVPALLYMAYYAVRTFRVANELRIAQEDKNHILSIQNETLDRLVQEKTEDIQAQNEEIMAQNEEIRAHNDQLILSQNEIENARAIIEAQAITIQRRNADLQIEVENQTKHLRQTNAELVEHNGRLEQFSYIISHNLRGPLARVQGLVSLLSNPQSEAEKNTIHQLLLRSSHELDSVITDLGLILNIRKLNTEIRTELLLSEVIKKVLKTLESEIHHVKATINKKVDRSETILSLRPYVESIFYNLISNALKYRHSQRALSIDISTNRTAQFLEITISDNGLGIDLSKYGDQLFNLYKRFHLHVEGKGLGLYLVRTQIEALGGRIEVQSEIDKGTQFTLFFKV